MFLRNELTTLLIKEERFWKQRAKVQWLKEGDQNTRFFHSMALARRKCNKIKSLQNEQGLVVAEQNGKCDIANSCFADLIKAKENEHALVTDAILPCISEMDNNCLLSFLH